MNAEPGDVIAAGYGGDKPCRVVYEPTIHPDHDEWCEAELIVEAEAWTACRCAGRAKAAGAPVFGDDLTEEEGNRGQS